MSGDGQNRSPVRRPRAVGRPRLPPGPLADLKALIYQLYLEAGIPSLDEIAALINADDGLAGAPERDTVGRIIRDSAVPASQADVVAVVTVLARAARWDPLMPPDVPKTCGSRPGWSPPLVCQWPR